MSAEKLARTLFRHRIGAACAVLLITVVGGLFAARVTVDNAVEIWFLEDDPDLLVYEAFTARFDFDETLVIAVFGDDVFEPRTLALIDRVTRAAERAPFVQRVLSITNSTFLVATDEDERPLRERALDNEVVSGTLVTADAHAAAIIIQVARAGNEFQRKRALVSTLRDTLDAEGRDVPAVIRMSGTPVIDDAAMRHSNRDVVRMVPVIVLITALVPLLVFRSAIVALLPLAVVAMACVWAYGLMGLLGWRVTLISTLLLPLILVVGVAAAIHLICRYVKRVAAGAPPAVAVQSMLAELVKPCCVTTATTMAGILSLAVSRLEPLREFAVAASAGVLAALVISFGLLPAALGLVRNPRALHDARSDAAVRLARASRRFGVPILIGGAIVVALFTASIWRLDVGIDPMSWFPRDDPVRIDTEAIDAALSGSVSFEFLVSSVPGGLQDPDHLRRLDDFERWLETETPVNRVISVVDLLKEATRTAFGEGPELPVTRLVARTLMGEIDDTAGLDQWVSSDHAMARLSARASLTRADEVIDAVPGIEAEIAARFPDEPLRVELTGYAKLMVQMQQYVLAGQIESLLAAFAVITLILMALLGDWRLVTLGMLVNVAPIIVGLGAMPWLGIGLNPATIMVGAAALGIIVDDTVHFLNAFSAARRGRVDVDTAVQCALEEVGRPVWITSLLLAAGFGALYLGEFVPSRHVGLLTAVVAAVALPADLLILPALLRFASRRGWLAGA